MKMYIRRVDQDQMVETSYGYDRRGLYAYRRTRTERSVKWWRGKIDWSRDATQENGDEDPPLS